jgi:hypothetical protein
MAMFFLNIPLNVNITFDRWLNPRLSKAKSTYQGPII